MPHLHHGAICFAHAPFAHALRLGWRVDDQWKPLELIADGDAFAARDAGLRVRLQLTPACEGETGYELSFTSERPTRLRLAVEVSGATGVFHVIPGVIFGDNNLAHAEPGHFPNLTTQHAGNVSCSPSWELRADRASHPVSIVCFDGGVAGISIDPYSDGRPLGPSPEGFIRNGLFAELASEGSLDACGVTLGYGNLPRTFLNKDQWLDPTAHFTHAASARGSIHLLPARSRLDAHRIIRRIYDRHHEPPATPITQRDAAAALTDAFLNINWHGPDGRNNFAPANAASAASAFLGGGGIRDNFTNMRCGGELKKNLKPWRTLAEIGWTGGGVIAYPLLVAGHRLGDATATARAVEKLDLVAGAFNPDSGLLWDVHGKHEGKRLNWWWSGYLVKDCHCAYTNGTATYYMLKAYGYARDEAKFAGNNFRGWLETSCRVLNTMLKLQRADGSFGFTYRTDRPEVIDGEGFAGAWFIPAMVYAHRFTGEAKYLESAKRGAAFYHGFVRDLNCWGAPMDTWKAVDQEGNLAFIRGARLLHEATGDPAHLQMLADGAEYEYLWRYGFRARPQYPPLKGSHWSSVGGSTTSVSNPHIHPMGVYVSADLFYLSKQLCETASGYHARRAVDGVRWGINIVSLYPGVTGYGAPGVVSERFCPSDGLTIESYPDGSPSSLWFAYNGWAAAAVLEGLIETLV